MDMGRDQPRKCRNRRLKKRQKSITAAESLTAGLFQATLGDFSGVSAIFNGGFVTTV